MPVRKKGKVMKTEMTEAVCEIRLQSEMTVSEKKAGK